MAEIEEAPPPVEDFDRLYGLTEEVVASVRRALDEPPDGEAAPIDTLPPAVLELHPADMADLLEQLTDGQRSALIRALGPAFDPEALSYLDESVRLSLLDEIDNVSVAQLVSTLETDDALQVIETLDEEDQREVLDAIPAEERLLYEQSLAYPEYTAGRLMRREVVAAPEFWTVGQTIDFMRDAEKDVLPDDFYTIIVVGSTLKPVGKVYLSHLLRARRNVPLAAIMTEDMKTIPATMDQEDVAFLFRQYGLVEAPVVDEDGRLVGAITVDDVVDVMDEEAEDDILKMGGVSEDDFYDDVVSTTRMRFSWLAINLVTAIAASLVIGLFEASITKVAALAVLMPIVASMGGNAGTQTLTVAVRALATNELTTGNALRIVMKETLVGGVNGLLFALLMGLIAWAWFADPLLGSTIAVAMVVNLVIAGLTGVLIPILLDRWGLDPAVASSVILTTVTDVVGFFVFLGLATLVLF